MLDSEVISACDVQFDLLWRQTAGDTTVVSWTHHFDPIAGDFDAIPYEDTETSTVEVKAGAGAELVFRFGIAGTDTGQGDQWVPNGDGSLSNGRIPNITPPQ